MPIFKFNIYTARGYAGDLVDSGPRVTQTGVLVPNATGVAQVGFGYAVLRQITGTPVDNGVEVGATANIFAVTQREANIAANVTPAKNAAGTWAYRLGDSVSIMRQGYIYIQLAGSTSIAAGAVLHVNKVTGEFTKDSVAGDVIATTNMVADQAGVAGEVIKVRMDIVNI